MHLAHRARLRPFLCAEMDARTGQHVILVDQLRISRVYEQDASAFRQQMHDLFTRPGASGLPGPMRNDGKVCAVLAPHIDYGRGGLTYTYAFKELVESTPAALFVIIGTSHYSPHRYTLTRKHFQTPLGVVPTDQDYIDRLVRHYGDGLFDDETR